MQHTLTLYRQLTKKKTFQGTCFYTSHEILQFMLKKYIENTCKSTHHRIKDSGMMIIG